MMMLWAQVNGFIVLLSQHETLKHSNEQKMMNVNRRLLTYHESALGRGGIFIRRTPRRLTSGSPCHLTSYDRKQNVYLQAAFSHPDMYMLNAGSPMII